jgi:hypothetical protein
MFLELKSGKLINLSRVSKIRMTSEQWYWTADGKGKIVFHITDGDREYYDGRYEEVKELYNQFKKSLERKIVFSFKEVDIA